MKSLMNKWKHKNHGSSFVVVVVSLTFIGIIALALLSVTLMNYKRMALSRKNDATYYAVEKAADQLKTGLIDEANQALQDAYLQLEPQMKYYNPSSGVYEFLPDDEANRLLRNYFITNLYARLGGSDESAQYNKLCSYIASTAEADLVEPSTAAGLLGSSYDFGITATANDNTKTYKIEVRGLLFESDTSLSDGYAQNLYTDFEISAPSLDIKFNTKVADAADFLEYILVADDGFEIKGAGTNQFRTIINGNIYAGVDWDANEVTFDTTYNNRYDYSSVTSINSGIYASNTILSINADDLVTAGNIVADNSSTISIFSRSLPTEQNQLWCRNIITMNSDEKKTSASMDISGVMNVYDDLELNATSSLVKLSGSYYGYNYGTFGSDSGYAASSYEGHMQDVSEALYKDLSSTYGKHYNTSSILINGSKSQLDMVDLTQLTVQGKTHIDLGNDSYVTGESISAKGNQLAYSVPNVLLDDVNGFVGINEMKLDQLGDAGVAIKRLLTSNVNVCNYIVFPTTEYTYDAKSGRYFYAFKDDEIPMPLPWDSSGTPVRLTAEQKAEAYIQWYVAGVDGYTNNTEFPTYDVATGLYGSRTAFKIGSIKISDNGNYGKVFSSGAITVKEDSSATAESAILSVGVGITDASLSTNQAQKIRDYNSQLHYLRNTEPGDDPNMGAVTSSPVNVFLDVIDDTAAPVSSREFTDAAKYLLNLCNATSNGIVTETDAANPSLTLYSLWIKRGRDIVVDRDFKGFIFTTEDVIIQPGCERIEGMICAGGKVYVEDRNTDLYLEADSDVMQNLIFKGFSSNSNTIDWLKSLFRVSASEEGDPVTAIGTINEDKNLRNYNCAEDVITKNYRKNIEYESTS